MGLKQRLKNLILSRFSFATGANKTSQKLTMVYHRWVLQKSNWNIMHLIAGLGSRALTICKPQGYTSHNFKNQMEVLTWPKYCSTFLKKKFQSIKTDFNLGLLRDWRATVEPGLMVLLNPINFKEDISEFRKVLF